MQKINDGHEPASRRTVSPHEEKDPYTPTGEHWSVEFGDGPGKMLVLHDGRGRGLFWMNLDERADPPAIALVRLATDSLVFEECGRFLAPPSASSLTAIDGGLDAVVESHSWRDDGDDFLQPIEGEDAIPRCRVHARLTWNRDEGFREQITDEVPCKPGELPRAVVIDQNGALLTRALKPSTER
jgi:hypothetical protein